MEEVIGVKGKNPRKKHLPKVGFTRFGHSSHVKGIERFLRTKFSRKKLPEMLDLQCKRLQKEIVLCRNRKK